MKLRILFLNHASQISGGEIALFNLVSQLNRTKYEPIVCLFSDGPLVMKLRESEIETYVFPLADQILHTRKNEPTRAHSPPLNYFRLVNCSDLCSGLPNK